MQGQDRAEDKSTDPTEKREVEQNSYTCDSWGCSDSGGCPTWHLLGAFRSKNLRLKSANNIEKQLEPVKWNYMEENQPNPN